MNERVTRRNARIAYIVCERHTSIHQVPNGMRTLYVLCVCVRGTGMNIKYIPVVAGRYSLQNERFDFHSMRTDFSRLFREEYEEEASNSL